MVRFGNHAFARVESRATVSRLGHGEVADTDIHPDHAGLLFWGRISDLSLKTHEQVELLPGVVIPQLCGPKTCPVLDQGDMLAVSGIGEDDAPTERQDTHPVLRLETVVVSQLVSQRGRDVRGWLIQPLVAFLREARFPICCVLFDARPERFVGGSNLTGDGAGHLRGYLVAGAYLAIHRLLQLDLVGSFAVRVGIAAHRIQGISVGELCRSQYLELFRRGHEFEFGDQGLFHRTSVP